MRDEFIKNMNSPTRINKHIHFLLPSSSPADDTEHRGATPHVVFTTNPMI